MALVSINGQDGVETRICMPRTGAWHVDALVDDPDALIGPVTIDINNGDLTMSGTVVRSGVFADTGHLRISAGAAGLGMSATPQHYQGPTVRTVLSDLLGNAGETLSGTADAGILATGLDAWTTTATPIGTLVTLLLAAAAPGSSWRMLPDGTLWVGRETWPDLGTDSTTYQIFEDSAESGTMLIGVDVPLALVGTTFEGRKVSYTEANVGQQGHGVEMRIWFESETTGSTDRMKKALASIAQRANARTDRVDYGRMYPATIVSQSGATVDVQPDLVAGKPLLPDMAGVPLLLGLPGASVDQTAGGRISIGWFGGDPARPFAANFDPSNAATTVVIAVSQFLGAQLFLGAQAGAEPPPKGTSFLSALATLLVAVNTYAIGIAPIADPSVTFTPALTAAIVAFNTSAQATLAQKVSVA